jgi:microsomal dipeptidase-like Zn-dependent dipeptidase
MNYSEQDVKNILGENILRLLEKVDAVGKEIRAGK